MIDEPRTHQIVEFEHDKNDHHRDGRFKRYRVFSVDEKTATVLVVDLDPKLEAIPLDVAKRHMVVLQEASPPAAPPDKMTKDDVFNSVFEFINHERDCVECGGEIDGGDLSERYRYFCEEAKKMLAWFVQRP